jgi:hypothetical protein
MKANGFEVCALRLARGSLLALAAVSAQAAGTLTTNSSLMETQNLVWRNSGVAEADQVGGRNMSFSGTTGSFWAYCVDPGTGTNSGALYNTVDLATYIKGTNAANPSGYNYTTLFTDQNHSGFANAGYTAQNTTVVYDSLVALYSHAFADSQTTSTKSAAFGYAVWEILGQASPYSADPVTGGALKMASTATAAFQTQVNAYLGALNSGNWGGIGLAAATAYTYTVYAAASLDGSQNFLTATAGATPPTKVPEPSMLALLAACALAWRLAQQRKRGMGTV